MNKTLPNSFRGKRKDKEFVELTKQTVCISYEDLTFSSDFTAVWSTLHHTTYIQYKDKEQTNKDC